MVRLTLGLAGPRRWIPSERGLHLILETVQESVRYKLDRNDTEAKALGE